jgi:hypothetical protein
MAPEEAGFVIQRCALIYVGCSFRCPRGVGLGSGPDWRQARSGLRRDSRQLMFLQIAALLALARRLLYGRGEDAEF